MGCHSPIGDGMGPAQPYIYPPPFNFTLLKNREISGGVVGIILDGRGRPFDLPTDPKTRVSRLKEWMLELDIYPKERLEKL